jgi:hypothetical protein
MVMTLRGVKLIFGQAMMHATEPLEQLRAEPPRNSVDQIELANHIQTRYGREHNERRHGAAESVGSDQDDPGAECYRDPDHKQNI